MGLGSATKKIQQVADTAEKLYEKLNELRAQVSAMREDVTETRQRVDAMEHQVDRQAVLLEALAEKEGIDVDRLYAEAAIEEAEPIPDAEGEDTAVEEAEADGGAQ
jgi:septal ring factor EnvC (AmiA/AmiB activator)